MFGIIALAFCPQWEADKDKYCAEQIKQSAKKTTIEKCNEIVYKKCCALDDHYCVWYDSSWFLVTCILIGVLIAIAIFVVIVYCFCCKKGRGGGGNDQKTLEDQEASETGEEA